MKSVNNIQTDRPTDLQTKRLECLAVGAESYNVMNSANAQKTDRETDRETDLDVRQLAQGALK